MTVATLMFNASYATEEKRLSKKKKKSKFAVR